MDNDSIRQNIRELRLRKGLSKVEMADRLDIDRCTYGKIESGGAQLINKHLPGIATILGVSVSELVNGYEPDKDAIKTIAMLEERRKSLSQRIEELNRIIEDLRGQIAKDDALISAKDDLLAFYRDKARLKTDIPEAMATPGMSGINRGKNLSDPQEEY